MYPVFFGQGLNWITGEPLERFHHPAYLWAQMASFFVLFSGFPDQSFSTFQRWGSRIPFGCCCVGFRVDGTPSVSTVFFLLANCCNQYHQRNNARAYIVFLVRGWGLTTLAGFCLSQSPCQFTQALRRIYFAHETLRFLSFCLAS